MISESLPERIASVTDQVQDWAVEELGSIGGPTNWPQCPQHPDSHPLAAVVREGRAVWHCPKTGPVVSEIGQLPTPGDRSTPTRARSGRSGRCGCARSRGPPRPGPLRRPCPGPT
jgi:hypothetical protein